MSTLEELALSAQNGDRDALESLVRALQDRLYRVSLRMLANVDAARDATQEILVLIVTRLSTFRAESTVTTWAYAIAIRYLVRARKETKRWSFERLVEEDLGQPPNEIAPETLACADARLLEQEVFVGCTQAMLQALDSDDRIAFTLGALCDIEMSEAAAIVGISVVAFRKRLSRARATLDAFLSKHCGVADPSNPCRCAYQVNHNVARGRLDPERLQYMSPDHAGPEVMRALGEIRGVRRSLELFRAQPSFVPGEAFHARMRSLLASMSLFSS